MHAGLWLQWHHLTIFCSPTRTEKHLAGKHYRSDDEVIIWVQDFFEDQNESFYTAGVQALQHRWKKSVTQGRQYWKINLIWSNSTSDHSHPMKFQPTLVYAWCPMYTILHSWNIYIISNKVLIQKLNQNFDIFICFISFIYICNFFKFTI